MDKKKPIPYYKSFSSHFNCRATDTEACLIQLNDPVFLDHANRTINFSQLIWSDVQDDDDKQLSNQEKTQVTRTSKKKNLAKGSKTRFTCKFLPRWLNEEEDENGDKLSQYIIPDKDDKHRAICTVSLLRLALPIKGRVPSCSMREEASTKRG